MRQGRTEWTRRLTEYRTISRDLGDDVSVWDCEMGPSVETIHAQSRFKHRTDHDLFAVYVMQDAAPDESRDVWPLLTPVTAHTLSVVREFRRVPMEASALGLLLFTAHPGLGARMTAALAHFVERAISLWEPAYVLLARSLEVPCMTALIMAVQECAVLESAGPTAFSLDPLLPEVRPLLAEEPESYAYCRAREAEAGRLVSPFAV